MESHDEEVVWVNTHSLIVKSSRNKPDLNYTVHNLNSIFTWNEVIQHDEISNQTKNIEKQ